MLSLRYSNRWLELLKMADACPSSSAPAGIHHVHCLTLGINQRKDGGCRQSWPYPTDQLAAFAIFGDPSLPSKQGQVFAARFVEVHVRGV